MVGAAMEAPAQVEAEMVYTVRGSEKPVAASVGPRGQVEYPRGTYESRRTRIANGRLAREPHTLDRDGFTLVAHVSAVPDFYDDEVLRRVCYPEVERLVAELTGAVRVHVFDRTIRTGDVGKREARGLREPVGVVHNDYTDWSGPQRVRDILPGEATGLLRRRVAVVQVWRAIGRPVLQQPLAICEYPSVAAEDLIASERRHADRVGEIHQVAYNPAQRWVYFPVMRPDEALVFKTWDSAMDGRARFAVHGSFVDPTAPADAPPRDSIELRAFAFF